MSQPVDLLMITWNRRPYVERTLRHLMADPSDFRVYWWDNGSTDGAAEVMMQCRDKRIVERNRAEQNMMQAVPTYWFLDRCRSDVIGKLDDDTLAPHGWTERLSRAVREEPPFGMLGCWTYWKEDFDRNREGAMDKLVRVGSHRVLRVACIGGTAFVMRKELAQRFRRRDSAGKAFPVDRWALTRAGYISGWYYPLLWAEHMDDPRSAHCLMNRPGGMGVQAALTARARGFDTPLAYQQWIMEDADQVLGTPLREHLHRATRWYKLWTRVKKRVFK